MQTSHQQPDNSEPTTVTVYSAAEELANALSHLLGVILSIVALILMLNVSADDSNKLLSSTIYGVSMILLFLTSTIYHSVKTASTRALMKTLDHCAIYLLIAGTYTPFMLISLEQSNGMFYLTSIWIIAALGILFKLTLGHRYPKTSLASYLFMGWFVVFAGNDMLTNVPEGGLYLLAAGGISYTLGAVFYAWESLFFNHAIWHIFVLAGAGLHFLSIYWYVLA